VTVIDKRRGSQICSDRDEFAEAFRSRPLDGSYPCLWSDALHLKIRPDLRTVSLACVLTLAVWDTGER
jgi:transposase-like protein